MAISVVVVLLQKILLNGRNINVWNVRIIGGMNVTSSGKALEFTLGLVSELSEDEFTAMVLAVQDV